MGGRGRIFWTFHYPDGNPYFPVSRDNKNFGYQVNHNFYIDIIYQGSHGLQLQGWWIDIT